MWRAGAAASRPLSPPELDLDRLAGAGYHALCAQGAWQCRSALALTRMSLAPAVLEVPLEARQGRTPPPARDTSPATISSPTGAGRSPTP